MSNTFSGTTLEVDSFKSIVSIVRIGCCTWEFPLDRESRIGSMPTLSMRDVNTLIEWDDNIARALNSIDVYKSKISVIQ